MSLDVLTANAMSAESLAEQVTHWQLLDIVHVSRNGTLAVGAARPWKPLAQLIQYGVLKYASGGTHLNLVHGPRFQAVLYAMERSGRIAKHERAVL